MGQWDEIVQGFDVGIEKLRADYERGQLRLVEVSLERKYASRKLKFTDGFCLLSPQEAFGWLDGMRFYFRFEHDTATIRLGPFNEELEGRIHTKDRALRFERRKLDYESWERGEISGPELFLSFAVNRDMPKASVDDAKYVPCYITNCSSIENVTNDARANHLSPATIFDVFSELVDNLEEVDEPDRIPAHIREWLET